MLDGRMPNDHRGTRAIQRMVEFAPSTGGLALWVKHHDHPPTSEAPAVTTDGTTLFYGPSFEALALAEQIGLVAHEVLHIALRHPQRFLELKQLLGDVDLKLYNICADAIVNSSLSHLKWLRLPRNAVLLDELLLSALALRPMRRRRCSNGTSSGSTARWTTATTTRRKAARRTRSASKAAAQNKAIAAATRTSKSRPRSKQKTGRTVKRQRAQSRWARTSS